MQWKLLWVRMTILTLVAVYFAGAGTVVTLTGNVLQNAFQGPTAEFGSGLQKVGMVTMLIGGILFLIALFLKRGQEAVPLTVLECHGRTWFAPVRKIEILAFDRQKPLLRFLKEMGRARRLATRIVLIPGETLSEEVLEILQWYPSLELIDVSNGSIDDTCFEMFTDLNGLRFLFIAGTLPEERVAALRATLPEVKIVAEPTILGFAASRLDPVKIASLVASPISMGSPRS